VQEAFGDTSGFIAVFCEWSMTWSGSPRSWPSSPPHWRLRSNPKLASNGLYMFAIMMIIFLGHHAYRAVWFESLEPLQFHRCRYRHLGSGGIGRRAWAGISVLGKAIQLPPFTLGALVPSININTLPFLATIVLMFAGMEMAGFHALEVRKSTERFPKSDAVVGGDHLSC